MLVVASTFIAAFAGAIFTVVSTPMYSSTTSLFVSTPSGDNTSDLLTGSTFTQQRVKSYAGIVSSPSVLDPVVTALDLADIQVSLPKRITANVPLNTVVIEITVTDESPFRAASIANAVGESLTNVVASLETPTGSSISPIKLSTIEPGTVATSPDSPRPLLNMALAILAGLVIGFGVALLRENLDLRIKNVDDIPEKDGVANILGGIVFDENADSNRLVVHTRPKSTRAEAFRQLRTNVQFVEAAQGAKSIVLSSSIPSEGKSSTIANLAIAMADAGQKVLLIDCDLRKPKVHKYFGLEGSVGLTNYLIDQAQLEDVIQPWGRNGLKVLPAGQIPPNPSELLGSAAMKKLLLKLEQDFDLILLDTAPVLPVTDTAILSKITGGVVMVVAVGKTTKPQLQGALAQLETVGATLLGFVMNKIPTKGVDAYGYHQGYKYGYKYGYSYSYGAYSEVYGEEETPTAKPAATSMFTRPVTPSAGTSVSEKKPSFKLKFAMPRFSLDFKRARKVAGEYVQVFQTEIKKIAERFNKKS
jgi:capsular exopolysaccharide synthesis family protein